MVFEKYLEFFKSRELQAAIIWKNKTFSFDWLYNRINFWTNELKREGVKSKSIVILESNFSPNTIAIFFALIKSKSIIVPLLNSKNINKDEFYNTSQAEVSIYLDFDENLKISLLNNVKNHKLYQELNNNNKAGLLLFTSGSTGKKKGVLHDLEKMLAGYLFTENSYRTLLFLLFDHIGGLHTLFYSLSKGSCLVIPDDRCADSLCRAIESKRVEVFPTTPSFLNLLILSNVSSRFDLSSLKYITFGAEVMPSYTLEECKKHFPTVSFIQQYGSTELGILKSKPKDTNALFLKLSEKHQVKVYNNLLYVKTDTSMLGYINAPSPFDDEGWYNTKDFVESEYDCFRVVGRESNIINIGGEKVIPAEVEEVILSMDGVENVLVHGEKNSVLGEIVCSTIKLKPGIESVGFSNKLRKYCFERLESYQIPMKIYFSDNDLKKKI